MWFQLCQKSIAAGFSWSSIETWACWLESSCKARGQHRWKKSGIKSFTLTIIEQPVCVHWDIVFRHFHNCSSCLGLDYVCLSPLWHLYAGHLPTSAYTTLTNICIHNTYQHLHAQHLPTSAYTTYQHLHTQHLPTSAYTTLTNICIHNTYQYLHTQCFLHVPSWQSLLPWNTNNAQFILIPLCLDLNYLQTEATMPCRIELTFVYCSTYRNKVFKKVWI